MLIVSLILLVDPAASVWFGGFFNILQYAYRLTSYVNLSILVIVIILAGRMGRANVHSQQVINVCLAFCIGHIIFRPDAEVSACVSDAHKSTQINRELWAPLPFGSHKHLDEIPESFGAATVIPL